jgi:hypothetical protein
MVEHPSFLDTAKAPSRTDVLAYCRTAHNEPVVIAVEGKAGEPFGPTVGEWRQPGGQVRDSRRRRLEFLCDRLGLVAGRVDALRYQLLHRTASAVIEAQKVGAVGALMLVHAFAVDDAAWADFRLLLHALDVDLMDKDAVGGPVPLGGGSLPTVPTYFAWVQDVPRPA